jgi:hypothetical protein
VTDRSVVRREATLRPTLPAFGPTRLLSARGARFADTLRPPGADLGLAVEPETALGEDDYATHPRRGLTRILALAGARHTTAVCAPGTVIRHLVAAPTDDAGLALGALPARTSGAGLADLGGQVQTENAVGIEERLELGAPGRAGIQRQTGQQR